MQIPPRRELNEALKRTDPDLLDSILDFLEADPIEMESGYAKDQIWHYITHYDLIEAHRHQLEGSALKMLNRPLRREHKRMFRAMAKLGSADFWKQVESKLRSDNPIVKMNAWRLLQYRQGLDYGERQQITLAKGVADANAVFWQRLGYRHSPSMENYLLKVMTAPEQWRTGRVVYREPESRDLPITLGKLGKSYTPLAALNYRACEPDQVTYVVIPVLFNTGSSGYGALKSQIPHWIAALYVLGNAGNDRIVPVIEHFYAYRLEYELDSASRRLGIRAVHHALQRIGTPTALRAARQYAHPDAWYAEARLQFDGWLKEIDHRE